jgi:cytoskeletal protein CcmA (bactofilin family)
MGFFNDLREDLASAVNQLTDDRSENDIEISSKQMKDEIAKKEKKNKKDKRNNENLEREIKNYLNVSEEANEAEDTEENSEQNEVAFENAVETNPDDNEAPVTFETADTVSVTENIVEETMDNTFSSDQITADYQADSNDFSVISKGTVVHGGIDTTGSIEINGVVEGPVKANGELILSGTINGDVEALIISVNAGRIKGNIKAFNGIYISDNSVIIGDIESTEAEIGGAVKGKIDVNGPVVLKSEAKVLGDIDCKSVEINNGGVIEGKCSQKYADVSPSAFFENL